MYRILKKYSEKKNGLLVVVMPTGSGKTYSANNFMVDSALDPAFTRKIFYLTTQKKNLPKENDFDKFLKPSDDRQKLKEKYLRVESNLDSVTCGLNKAEVKNAIPKSIKETEEYKQLINIINNIEDLKSIKNEYCNQEKERARQEIEPQFRRMLQYRLEKEFRNVKDRIKAIRENDKWSWIKELYPSVLIRDKDIICMTMDKFLMPFSLIAEPDVRLENSNIIDNAIIIIDEFDATKENVLKNIISDSKNKRIDPIEFFKTIYFTLHNHYFPKKFTQASSKKEKSNNENPLDIIEELKKMSKQIYRKYHLYFNYKTENTTDKSANNFLFQDARYYSIINGNKSYVTWEQDKNEQANIIKFSDKYPTGSGVKDIKALISELNGFASYFLRAVGILAHNYKQTRLEDEQNQIELTVEEAVRTVLSEFNINGNLVDRLTGKILSLKNKSKLKVNPDLSDMSFYEKGFRYYAFEDDCNHDTLSKIMSTAFPETPEKRLLRVCRRAMVIGISATATNPSVIGNYSLNYIAAKLDDKIMIDDEDQKRLATEFNDSVKGYDNVNIHPHLIGWKDWKSWKDLPLSACEDVAGKEYAGVLYNIIMHAVPKLSSNKSSEKYYKVRYLKIAAAFDFFLTHPDIQSFLCVLNKHPREGDMYLDLKVLKDIFKYLAKVREVSFDIENNLVQLDGENYDEKKDNITSRLGKNGDRLFVISVYQTIGAGQNLQYPVPDAYRHNIVKINDRSDKDEKDYDAIYLDMPTNLITNFNISNGEKLEEDDFLKFIFQVEMLEENGEISVDDSEKLIKRAFKFYYGVSLSKDTSNNTVNVNDCPSVKQLSTKTIEQAVGRVCRTNKKSKNIYILADRDIIDRIDFDICETGLHNKEFLVLASELKKVKQSTSTNAAYEKLKELGRLKSNCSYRYIASMLSDISTPETIRLWKQLREITLRYPTISEDQFVGNIAVYQKLYVEMPFDNDHIYYRQKGDYKDVEIFFSRPQEKAAILSSEASKLDKLMENELIRKYFEENGWATSFAPNKFILSPPLFNNIYRGALGEVVGRFIFKQKNIELQDIEDTNPEYFEKFDYKIRNTSVYVDFKNWHETTTKNADVEIAHILKKGKECGAKCVIVANILADNSNLRPNSKIKNGIEIVRIPMLLNSKSQLNRNQNAWRMINDCRQKYSN